MTRPALHHVICCLLGAIAAALLSTARADDAPTTAAEARAALAKATRFFHEQVAVHGGYVWVISSDLQHRQGEGRAGEDVIWTQPPGTPAIGEALLDAYEATGDEVHLAAAKDAAAALVKGQLQSGGWFYHVDFSQENPRGFDYRNGRAIPPMREAGDSPGGWDLWRKRGNKGNMTILDDDVTQSATRFLVRMDRALQFKDKAIHAAALYALESLLRAQYPSGGWSASYDRFPAHRPAESHYPIQRASYPKTWSRTWTKDFTGCYVLNDDVMQDMIDTMLLAGDVYKDERYLNSAKSAGDFLILAQMPDPQPAWAQQYDRRMQPIWSRAFEPPAVTGGESQGAMRALLRLYRRTGARKYLKPIPPAIAYLRKCLRDDGRLVRFYELQTNRPLYFKRGPDGRHVLTYSDKDLPDHYAWIVDQHLDAIEREHDRLAALSPSQLKAQGAPGRPRLSRALEQLAARTIAALDDRGAWTEEGIVRDENNRKLSPAGGVISSKTFIANIRVLCRYVRATEQN